MSLPSTESVQPWRRLVDGLTGGKCVGDDRYVHRSAVPVELADALQFVAAHAGCELDDFDVVRVSRSAPRVALLRYPGFFTQGFPTLTMSWRVDLATGECQRRSYRDDGNPPVLHRKEQMLAPDDPRRELFAALTADAEARGLFADTTIIGHRDQWEEELRARGLAVVGHALVPRGDDVAVHRHRTAMARRALSTPMQALWRHGYLAAPHTVLDYGCGRGDDLAALRAIGLDANGWDPHFCPDGERAEADVVNLGFVLNVIENLSERAEALRRAYGFARKVLAVSVLVGGRTAYEKHRLFRDGVLTSRGTFQKYFTHAELGAYLGEVLGREPVSVGHGLYFVFRTDADEQDFLERRQQSQGVVAPSAPPREPTAPKRKPKTPPRAPAAPARSRTRTTTPVDPDAQRALDLARARREGDLLVFLALNVFEQRRSSGALGERVRSEVRALFGSLATAQDKARTMLFSLRDPKTLAEGCSRAAADGLGFLVEGESLQLDSRLVNELPPALRTYLGCAGKLLGEAQDADMVKVHIASGKATLLRHDDYEGAAIPMLLERVKVDLRRQQVTVFEYGDEYAPQPLYLKSRYMHPAQEGYAAQRAFDDALRALPGWSDEGYGPPLDALGNALSGLPLPPGTVLTATPRPR